MFKTMLRRGFPRFLSVSFALCVFAVISPMNATAANFPEKRFHIVVPYGPGGTGDVIARLVAQKLEKQFPQGVVVENRGGAAGSIGASTVARATSDGHTVLLGYTSEMVINPLVQRGLSYTLQDFEPVAFAGITPLLLVAHPSIGVDSFNGLVKSIRSKDRAYSYASAGTGSPAHIAGALLSRQLGVELLHVPYKGGSQAVTDTVAGVVDMYFSGMPPAVPFVKNRQLIALGVSSTESSPALPAIAPIATGDFREMDLAGWFGFFVPRDTPKPIIDQLNLLLNEALQATEVKEKLLGLGVQTRELTPGAFGEFVSAESEKYREFVSDLKIVAE